MDWNLNEKKELAVWGAIMGAALEIEGTTTSRGCHLGMFSKWKESKAKEYEEL